MPYATFFLEEELTVKLPPVPCHKIIRITWVVIEPILGVKSKVYGINIMHEIKGFALSWFSHLLYIFLLG